MPQCLRKRRKKREKEGKGRKNIPSSIFHHSLFAFFASIEAEANAKAEEVDDEGDDEEEREGKVGRRR